MIQQSTAEWLASRPRRMAREMAKLTEEERAILNWDWDFWARPNQKIPPGDWATWLVLAGRGFGKRLSVDTPIPTPDGWKLNGDLQDGDLVFDQAGKPTRVLKAHPIEVATRAYRVTFSDGTYIDADGEHLWTVVTHRWKKQLNRSGKRIQDLRGDWWDEAVPLWKGTNGGRIHIGEVRPITTTTEGLIALHAEMGRDVVIPVTQPLDLPERDLPCDPWLMGFWLGNGSGQYVSVGSWNGETDFDYVESRLPYATWAKANEKRPGVRSMKIPKDVYTFPERSVARDKAVPKEFMRASAGQRLELLKGLMDSDGCSSGGRMASFGSMSKQLRDDVAELARSLGQKPVTRERAATLNGREYGTSYDVWWKPTIEVFGSPRKSGAYVLDGPQSQRQHHRPIVSIEPIAPVPMRCITVDSPSSLYLAGEGMIPTHNTRMGSETVRKWACGSTPMSASPFNYGRIAIVAETAADARDVMVEGDSGILACHPKDFRPTYIPSKRKLEWPNGVTGHIYNATEPDQLRGPQHHAGWADELAKWMYAREMWDQLQFGMRLGDHPRVVVTTTPRPIPTLIEIVNDPTTFVTRGSTLDNRSNLSSKFINKIQKRYAGTRLGRQELEAEILLDNPGALWLREYFDTPDGSPHRGRVAWADVPPLSRIVVAIDPSGLRNGSDDGDSIGIIVAGVDEREHGYVLADLTMRGSPNEWGTMAVWAYRYYKADRIVAETNFGGGMVENVIRQVDPKVPYKEVKASRGKIIRAEPVAALYEQGRVSHVVGANPRDEDGVGLSALEDQACLMASSGYSGDGSPDRVDACLVAGTLVETWDGPVPIEDVKVGDLVLTREGYFPVGWSGMTRRDAETFTVAIGDGVSIEATAEHPVWTHQADFVPCSELTDHNTVSMLTEEHVAWAKNTRLKSSTAVTPIAAILTRTGGLPESIMEVENLEEPISTGKSGSTHSAQFRKGTSSTTRMETPSTTSSIISSACLGKTTQRSTGLLSWPNGAGETFSSLQLQQPPSGTEAKKEERGTESTAAELGTEESVSTRSSALSVGQPSLRSSNRTEDQGSVGTPAAENTETEPTQDGIEPCTSVPYAARSSKTGSGEAESRLARARVVRRTVNSKRKDVYNLHVDGPNEFFANGVLVHNCVWALTDLMLEEQGYNFKIVL